jgi:hypothetical protein
MKIIVRKSKFSANPVQFLRRAGYGLVTSRNGSDSFERRLSSGRYPRFHLYIDDGQETITFNLHLDQQPETASFVKSRHKGEYDGPLVEGEVVRLKQLIVQAVRGVVS